MRGGSSVKPGVKPWCQRAGYFCYIPNSWGDYLKKWNSSVAVHMFNWIMQSYEEWLCSWRLDLWWRSTYCMEMLLPNTRRFLVTSLEDHFPYSQWCFSSWTCYYMVVWKIYCPRFSFKSDRVILASQNPPIWTILNERIRFVLGWTFSEGIVLLFPLWISLEIHFQISEAGLYTELYSGNLGQVDRSTLNFSERCRLEDLYLIYILRIHNVI